MLSCLSINMWLDPSTSYDKDCNQWEKASLALPKGNKICIKHRLSDKSVIYRVKQVSTHQDLN